ncbi:MAG: NAD(P)H-dependent glycerol-3-phosphate dehydrogenase [Pseudomonadota bacterium]
MSSIAIVGKGAWGTALGESLRVAGHDVAYRGRGEASTALRSAELILMAVPAQATRGVLSEIVDAVPPDAFLVVTAKGLETGSMLRQSQLVAEALPDAQIAVLSGPGFAADLHRGLPTAITLATQSSAAQELQEMLATPSLRPYLSDDMIGAELGGALKNVIAIAAGIAIGAGLGESARAALIARGFAEMRRIATAAGAREETLAGLSGLGDLTLTATSEQSRNFVYGKTLGQTGAPPRGDGTYEGASSALAALALAARLQVQAPIIDTVSALVTGTLEVPDAIDRLYGRPLTRE